MLYMCLIGTVRRCSDDFANCELPEDVGEQRLLLQGFVGTDVCPVCGEPVFDTYQRIVGYLVPTRNYSKDRFKEYNTRRWYEYAEMLGE